MTIGGLEYFDGTGIDDVELTSLDTLDPDSSQIPECLSNLTPLPIQLSFHAGGLDYNSKPVFSSISKHNFLSSKNVQD